MRYTAEAAVIAEVSTMSKMEYSDEQLKDLLDGIFLGEITEMDIPQDLYFAIANYLKEGLYSGFGGALVDFDGKDLELLTKLRENVYMFSAAKSYQEILQIRSLLFDADGNKVSSAEFNRRGAREFDLWNSDWGRTEYNTAEASAQMASKWDEIEANKDILPNLTYHTIGDACAICAPMNGITAPASDRIWKTVYPPNHFNCLCTVTQEQSDVALTSKKDKDATFAKVSKNMSDVFKMNVGKDQYIFNPDHPYFEVDKKHKEYAMQNFNLPIPEKD